MIDLPYRNSIQLETLKKKGALYSMYYYFSMLIDNLHQKAPWMEVFI